MRYLLLALLPLSLALSGQKAKKYTTVTAALTQKIIDAPAPVSPVRLAVVPFTATASSAPSAAFGEYLTESIISALGGHQEKIKLFERTRMDAILREQEFILTDLMKPAAALKIGQIAPIDALLSGTFTKLKSYIDVSARVIDVASGEITASYSGRIKMDKNLAALFGGENPPPQNENKKNDPVVYVTFNGNDPKSTKATRAEICKKHTEEFRQKLQDLSDNDKIDRVITEAIKTPFDNLCGQLHYDVMNSFSRFKIFRPTYQSFLLHTLDTIAYPSGDERAYQIIRYLSSDFDIDPSEWTSGFAALSKVGDYSLSTYLSYLISKPATAEKVKQERVDAFFTRATAQKIGLPAPITYDRAFFEMMEGVKDNSSLCRYVYKTYSSQLHPDEKAQASLYSVLHAMYRSETDATFKTQIMGWLADHFNTHVYNKAPDQLYDLAKDFSLTLNDRRNEEISKEFPARDLVFLINRCQDKFSEYATRSAYTSQTEYRINFCVQHNIPVPHIIPTMEEAVQILQGKDLDEQLRIMKLIAQMGSRPKSIESSLVSLLSRRSIDEREKLSSIQLYAVVVLGNIHTSNIQAIEFMLQTLPHYGNDTEASKEALVKIGKPAVPALISQLDKTTEQEGGLQYQLITLLGRIGKDAAPAEKSIRRVLNATRNGDIRYAAEAALEVIK